jgi:ATP-dependent Clp protease, protease subunit
MKWLVVNTATDIPEITLSGYIHPDAKINYADFNTVINNLKQAGFTKAKLKINTGGGDMIEGLALYDAAIESGIEFDVQIVGMAASMGTNLMLIGNGLPSISKHGRVMFHKPQSVAFGESSSLRARADLADSLEKQVKAVLKEKTGKSDDVINAWFQDGKEFWMTASEAIANGVCRGYAEIEGEPDVLPVPDGAMSEQEIYNRVYNQISITKTTDMAYTKELKAKFGLAETATDAEVDAAMDAVQAQAKKAGTLEAQIADGAKNRATALVENAVKDGKITAAEKDSYIQQAIANPTFVENVFNKIPKPELPGNGINNNVVGGGQPEDRSKWTLQEWAKNDYNGLEAMKVTNRVAYVQLCKAAGITEVEA